MTHYEEDVSPPVRPPVRGASCLLLLAIALLAPGCRKEAALPPKGPPEVLVAPVVVRDVPITRYWIGVLDGDVNAQIRAQVSGYLLAQNYHDGDFVHKGDLLFQIDPRPLQAAIDQAKGRLAQAKGRLAQAEANLGKTEMDVKRYTPLVAKGAVSREDLDNAVAANLGAKADVAAAKAAVEQAALNLEFARIKSPVDGLAGLANAQIGDLVGPAGPPLATVSTIDPIRAVFNVSEQEVLACRAGFPEDTPLEQCWNQSELELILTDGSTYPLKGTSFASQRAVDPRTGTLQVVGRFPNPQHDLRPGMFARVRAQMGLKRGAILVPQRAVMELQGDYRAAVVDAAGVVHVVPVQAAERVGTEWVIEKGLKAGDRVVVEGLQKIHDGQTVTALLYTPAATSSAAPGATTPTTGATGGLPASATPTASTGTARTGSGTHPSTSTGTARTGSGTRSGPKGG